MTTTSSKQTTTQKTHKFLMSLKSTIINILILVVAAALMLSFVFVCINVKVDKLSAVSDINTQVQTVEGLGSSVEKTAYLVGTKKLLTQDSIRKWDIAMNDLRYRKVIESDLAAKANTATLKVIEEVDKQLAATTTD